MSSGQSNFTQGRPYGQAYAVNSKPAKINLIDEQPRRESLIEQQLTTRITRDPASQGSLFGSNNYYDDMKDSRSQSGNHTTTTSDSVTLEYYGRPMSSQSYQSSTSRTTQDNLMAPEPPRRTQSSTMTPNLIRDSQQFARSNKQEVPNDYGLPELSHITSELAQKEAKLRREMAYMNTYKNNPWIMPKGARESRKEPEPVQRNRVWVKDVPRSPIDSRPNSRASSVRSLITETDLLEKAAKLLQDVREIERKEIIDEPVVLDPRGTPSRAGTASPAGTLSRPGVKAAIINVPNREVNNKSPMPFAYDNFSTLGVRGNIASVGAAEPDKPYPPIFPQIKRTESPLGDYSHSRSGRAS